MAESLPTFIVRRLSELASEEKDVRANLRSIQEEQDQLHRAAQGAGIVIPADIESALDNATDDIYPMTKRKVSEKTIKETVIEILKEAGRPLTALQILPVINDRLNADYPRSSLSPQLSRLKADGLIELNGRNWCLASSFAKTNEAEEVTLEDNLSSAPISQPSIPFTAGSDPSGSLSWGKAGGT